MAFCDLALTLHGLHHSLAEMHCVFHHACYCPLRNSQGILDKDDFTLEELLDEDDLIQEVKSLNNRLLDL